MRFTAEPWRWNARESDSWYFVTVPRELSEEIADIPRPPTGFGSVPVAVRIGSTTWQTSIFPDKSSGCYVLPLKKAVRAKEGIEEGVAVDVRLDLR